MKRLQVVISKGRTLLGATLINAACALIRAGLWIAPPESSE